jgi:hypothetical protein
VLAILIQSKLEALNFQEMKRPVQETTQILLLESEIQIMDRSTTNPNRPILGSPSLQTLKPTTKAQRRSISFDWNGFSLFNPHT